MLAVRPDRRGHVAMDVLNDRPFQLDRIVLLRLRPEVSQVIGREIDAAGKRYGAVDDDQLAVHAAEHVRPYAQDPRRGIEAAQPHTGFGERRLERRGQVAGAEAVDKNVHLDAAPRRLDQGRMQFETDLVLEDDEGLDDDLVPCRANGLEYRREVLLAVLEQAGPVAAAPARAHSPISAASGAWSDRRDHGRRGSGSGAWTRALRT